MSKKFNKKPLATALGAAVVTSLSAVGSVNADSNPFGMTELSQGYQQVAEMACGEGKCGGKMKKSAEGKCAGAKKPAKEEGKCGAMMKQEEGKCGGMKGKEGSCGAMMEKMKDGNCGAMMKKKDGSCGAMMEKKSEDADKSE